ncbi:phospholipid phosphatase-related protein type 2a isoform X6 [Chiloscyllium plagiosum]|uniref:phospholipid phosphatase-related protein type 2a isoform X6 n=1 Tax=Chiloscyllium plagiosum TaxID=36176 RepID=UPI001CB7D569|nr:phospholipid phosphatase-related protein type 2a isoform X6 [Chiloscyllium plagiosum]
MQHSSQSLCLCQEEPVVPNMSREESDVRRSDSIIPCFICIEIVFGVYTFGLCATDIFVNAGQVVTGSPAPHFMTVCQPNYTALGCQLSTQFVNSENACTGSPGVVSSARRAFPCKDSALTMYAAVYTVMYVTIMFQAKGTRLTKPVLCLTLLCLTFLTGVVRVSEFRNHWSDVLVGFLTGGAVALFLVCCVLHNFKSLKLSRENPRGMQEPVCVKLALPCVESPLEKIAQLHSQKVRDQTSSFFPSTPDVLIATQSVMSEV